MKKIVGVIGLLVVTPIWIYLVYSIMKRVDASELMWLLFWIYVPALMLTGVLSKLAEDE